MNSEMIFKNARLVLQDQIVEGTLVVREGVISDISESNGTLGEDMAGDYLLPGLIELHTDHLEQHYEPRSGVRWNLMSAIQAHDVQIAGSGITTVFDCLRLGSDEDGGFKKGEMHAMSKAIADAQSDDRLRAEHRIHLRCEVSAPDVLDHYEEFECDHSVGLLSLMDHAPGQRQFQSMETYAYYYKTKRGLTEKAFQKFVDRRMKQSETYADHHRTILAENCHKRGIAIASHDDATLAHVEESKAFGVSVAEFPTSLEAAEASHHAGLGVLMGAPNVVRGKSHSGNIAAHELARHNVLDILSSDYVPLSLIHAPFILAQTLDHITLPQAIAMVSANPARQVGLNDRGRLATGLRADFVRVRQSGDKVPVVKSVWREGRRVV